jgi:spore germination cell wall hydrolase CwlJ-like protein
MLMFQKLAKILSTRVVLSLGAAVVAVTAASAAIKSPLFQLDSATSAIHATRSSSGERIDDDASVEQPTLTHQEIVALFEKRLAEFRAVRRSSRFVRTGFGFSHVTPIVPGKTDLQCLTQAIYYEARGEPEEGQVAVAQVVLNRSHAGSHYPASLCGVVFQGASRPGCQFSFACEGNRQGGPIQPAAWQRASDIAQRVMAGAASGDPRATHYHTAAVAPSWDRTIARLSQIGHHIFFGNASPPASDAQADDSDLKPTPSS